MENERTTKYTQAVTLYLNEVGHATNNQILSYLQLSYPHLSATTVHRITARMVNRREIGIAPSGKDNTMRFDSNIKPHDHFQCMHCDRLRDIDLPKEILNFVQEKLGNCKIDGRLQIQGSCSKCLHDPKHSLMSSNTYK